MPLEPAISPDGGAAGEGALLAREARDFLARSRREAARIRLLQVALLVGFLLFWWLASGRLVDRLFVSDPISVARELFESIADGTLWWHLRMTLIEMALGYVLGVTIGVSLAIAVTGIPWGQMIVRPLMLGVFAVPKVALAPIVIVWLGIYIAPKIALSASLVLFIVYFNTVAGIMSVNPRMQEVLRVMGVSRLGMLTKLTLPHASPYIFTAMRITAPGALIGAIIGEFLSANRGIGFFIAAASSRYDTARVFAGIASLVAFVLLLNMAVARLERHVTRWKPPEAETGAWS
jgi:NitT/TauT family transport system permease protein